MRNCPAACTHFAIARANAGRVAGTIPASECEMKMNIPLTYTAAPGAQRQSPLKGEFSDPRYVILQIGSALGSGPNPGRVGL
jgi:hypothetical protein